MQHIIITDTYPEYYYEFEALYDTFIGYPIDIEFPSWISNFECIFVHRSNVPENIFTKNDLIEFDIAESSDYTIKLYVKFKNKIDYCKWKLYIG